MSERALSEALAALAARTRALDAPPRVERALLDALGRRRRARLWLWAGAAVAAGLVLAVMAVYRSYPDAPPPPGLAATVRLAPPAPQWHPPPPPPRKAAAARLEIVTEFVPLRYGRLIEPGEFAQVMRVSLPRSSLARFGILVVPDLEERRVKADVLVGEDGLARAIRFVK
jgi:hypothetical protein